MNQIMGLSLICGFALLFLSLLVGPWALYAGLVLAGIGIVLLAVMLVQMVLS